MDLRRDNKKRRNAEGDRLSNLPDDLIHKILSFIDIKQAVETSALSSRWRYLWTSMPFLNFSSDYLYSKLVTNVLSSRNNMVEVSSFMLTFDGYDQVLVKSLVDYAFSHNVQQLYINCVYERKNEFPQSLFSSQCLKHLTLDGNYCEYSILTPHTWELPALVTLYLRSVTLYNDADKCGGLFSNCASLKNLTLRSCELKGLNDLNIFHPGLSSLTLEFGYMAVNVVTPQLKNLVIKYWRGIILISAPNLSSLYYKNNHDPLNLSAECIHLEKVHICISYPYNSKDNEDAHTHNVVSLLQKLHNVKFLTLNLEIIKFLSSYMELISHQPSPFVNLKGLTIYPDYFATQDKQTQQKITMSTKVENYLLGSSPGATLTMVSLEETSDVLNVASAQNLMRKLQVVLDQVKENGEINTTDKEQDRAELDSITERSYSTHPDMKSRLPFRKGATYIKYYWEDLNEQMEKCFKDAGQIVSILNETEGAMAKLSTSQKAKLQARFSDLCAQADTIMDNRMDQLKIQCDKKPRFESLLL